MSEQKWIDEKIELFLDSVYGTETSPMDDEYGQKNWARNDLRKFASEIVKEIIKVELFQPDDTFLGRVRHNVEKDKINEIKANARRIGIEFEKEVK